MVKHGQVSGAIAGRDSVKNIFWKTLQENACTWDYLLKNASLFKRLQHIYFSVEFTKQLVEHLEITASEVFV